VLAFLCVVALLQAGCGTIRTADPYAGGSLCPGGSGSPDRGHPLICINDETLAADPEEITVWDRERQPDGLPSNAPVMIRWGTKSGLGKLDIEFKKKGCIKEGSMHCSSGRCTALTERVTMRLPCDYKILLDGRERDPVVIVQPCCT
jgi:hypothetical protein